MGGTAMTGGETASATGGSRSVGGASSTPNAGGRLGVGGSQTLPTGGANSLGGSPTASLGGMNTLGGSGSLGTGGVPAIAEPASKNWVYIMLGQSNMQGYSPLEAGDMVAPPRVFKMLDDKSWAGASEPAGVWPTFLSPCRSFGMKLLEKVADPDVKIYLINAAIGGTSIEDWNPANGEQYLNMLPYLEAGMQMGIVRGFIWHQGESNDDATAPEYIGKFVELIAAVRAKVGDPTLPVVAGEIGSTNSNKEINKALGMMATMDPLFRVASAEGLTMLGPTDPHFDSASERLMGERMANAWWSILGK